MNFCPTCGFKLHFPKQPGSPQNNDSQNYKHQNTSMQENNNSSRYQEPRREARPLDYYSGNYYNEPANTQILEPQLPVQQPPPPQNVHENYLGVYPDYGQAPRRQASYEPEMRAPAPPERRSDYPSEQAYYGQGRPLEERPPASQNASYPSSPNFSENAVPYGREEHRAPQHQPQVEQHVQRQVEPLPPREPEPRKEEVYLKEESYRPVGVGSSKINRPRNPILPSNSSESYDDEEKFYDDYYDDEDEDPPKSKTGLLVFLLIFIIGVGVLLFLQITERIHLEELPSKVMALFDSGEKSGDNESSVSGEESAPNISDEGGNITTTTFNIETIAEYAVGEPQDITDTNVKITVKDINYIGSNDNLPEVEGHKYLYVHISLENTSADPNDNMRFSPHNFKLFVTDDASFRYPIVRNTMEGTLEQGQLLAGNTTEGNLIFSVPADFAGGHLCFTPREENSPLAKFIIAAAAAGEEEEKPAA